MKLKNIQITLKESSEMVYGGFIITLAVEHRDDDGKWVPILRTTQVTSERVVQQLRADDIGTLPKLLKIPMGRKLIDDLDELICNLEALRYHIHYGKFQVEKGEDHGKENN